jgi:hypothetical protein
MSNLRYDAAATRAREEMMRPIKILLPGMIAAAAASLALSAFVTTTRAQTVETGIVKLADSNIQYFSRGKGETIVLLPGGTLTVGYLDGLAFCWRRAERFSPNLAYALDIIQPGIH